MNEQKRQAYLRVMDIQPYFPRQVLAGAKPSPEYDFPSGDLDAVELPEQSTGSIKADARPTTRTPALEAIEELRARSTSTRKATVTPIRSSTQPQSSANDAESGVGAEAENALSFKLRYYRINEALAVLDEVPAQGSEQLSRESQKLMTAILKALGLEIGDASLRAEEFSWPMQAAYSSRQSPQVEAAKALSGFLQMRQETDGFKNLLVFAAQLEDVLLQTEQAKAARDIESNRGYFMTVTHSLASVLAVTSLKRDVWRHLQELRKRLIRSN